MGFEFTTRTKKKYFYMLLVGVLGNTVPLNNMELIASHRNRTCRFIKFNSRV
jgi:hypothetical protein